MGVLTQPAETLRQVNESRDMLQKAKEDMELSHEAKKLPRKHTFSKLPGFYGRKVEQAQLRKVLSNNPKLTVLFGATSVGKTALLREVLATDEFYVIEFDLRISGFADIRTLYVALCEHFEQFFEEVSTPATLQAAVDISRCTMMRCRSKSSRSSIWHTVSRRRRRQTVTTRSRLPTSRV